MHSLIALLALLGLTSAAVPPAYGNAQTSCKTTSTCAPTTKIFTDPWTSTSKRTKTTTIYKPKTVTTTVEKIYTTYKTLPVKTSTVKTIITTKTIPFVLTTSTVVCSTVPKLVSSSSTSVCTSTSTMMVAGESISTCTKTTKLASTYVTRSPYPEKVTVTRTKSGVDYSTSVGSKCKKSTKCVTKTAKPTPEGYD